MLEIKKKITDNFLLKNLEPEDYYLEDGLVVFTEKYHLKKGKCCKSACRHCPWGFKRNN